MSAQLVHGDDMWRVIRIDRSGLPPSIGAEYVLEIENGRDALGQLRWRALNEDDWRGGYPPLGARALQWLMRELWKVKP